MRGNNPDFAHVRRASLHELSDADWPEGALLNLVDATLPSSWSITLPMERNPVSFSSLLEKFDSPAYVDVGFTETGERFYVSLEEARQTLEGKEERLKIYQEAEIKTLQTVPSLLPSRYGYNSTGFSSFRDYTIIDELGIGTNKFLLCSENVLTAPPRNAELRPDFLFDNITLIVNCHKKEKPGRKYTVNSKKVVYYPIHSLLGADDTEEILQTFNTFNENIWEALKEGNVFCHCLAGVHRAACVAVSHYLWRYHKLGHTHLPCDISSIYQSLASRRPGVAPLSYVSLVRTWERHLIQSKK